MRKHQVFLLFLSLAAVLAYFGLLTPDKSDSQQVLVVREALAPEQGPVSLDLIPSDFDEPFVPTVQGADKEPLEKYLREYRKDTRSKEHRIEHLEAFLLEHPTSPWQASVRLNLGIHYHRTSRFTRSLRYLQSAWESLRELEEPRLKSLADHALGEYSLNLAHLGRIEDLEPLLESVKGRSVSGSATELLAAAREGLFTMKTKPEYAFWCGPAALGRIGEKQDFWTSEHIEILKGLTSTHKGTSLLQNRDLSRKVGLHYQMAFRSPGAEFLTPAVIHWKAGHFAALLEPEGPQYRVADDTAGFAREISLVTPEVLAEESSGYFLVPEGPLPAGWRAVSDDEGQTVWGRGDTGLRKDNDSTGDDDHDIGDDDDDDDGCGMTTWSAHTMLVSLRLKDTPVGLSPAAFAVPFTVTYAQREANQPAVFDYSNLGPKWTTNWTSFITDQRNTGTMVSVYKPGGGAEDYTFSSGSSVSNRGLYSEALLVDTGAGFRLDHPSGASQEYEQLIGTRYHLTKVTDPQGNSSTLEYDALGRLAVIQDAVGRAMTLSYELSDDPLKITKVTDPFGRSATFSYAGGRLVSITDTIGLTSSFLYGANDFIQALTTPYGTTTFDYGDINTNPSLGDARFLVAVDPEGRNYRVESSVNGPGNDSVAPSNMPIQNQFLNYRNTFVWAPNQLDAVPSYSKATVYHFLHIRTSAGNATSRVLESIKKPLENRLWFAYPNAGGAFGPLFLHNSSLPTHIGRVLGDGTTQLTKYQYNAPGYVTQMTDPAGRVFNYTYDTNQIDLTGVSTAGQNLFSATYDANHNITSLVDSSGGTTAFTYNSRGQVTSMTNPLGETTNYTYTLTGNLYTIEAPMQKATTFLYDEAERVSSVVDSEGYSAQVAYDALDRPVSVTYPDGTTDTITYDRLDVVATKDRLGRQTQMTHDGVGRVKTILDANGGTTSFGYGLVDSPTSLTDPNGNTTTFQFDLQARLQAKKYADGAQQTITYQPCCGRVDKVTDAAGNTKTYSYFIDNQLKGIDYGGTTPDVSFTNDTFLPRPLSMTDGQGTTNITYGAVGAPGANQVTSISGPFGDSATFAYDIAGRPVSSVVNDSPSSVTYDALWRPTSVTNELDTFQMDYLGKTGQVTSVTSAFGPAIQYTYAANVGDRRLLQIKNLRNNGTPLSQFDYSYDAVGQITQLTAAYSSGGDGGGDEDGGDDDDDCTCDGPGKKGHGKGKGHQNHGNGKGKGHNNHDHDPDCQKNKHKDHKGKHKAKGHDKHREVSLLEWLIKMVFQAVWGWDVSDWGTDDDCDNGGGGGGGGGVPANETWDFRYDNLSQLVGVDLNQTPYAEYEIDPAGNLTSITIDGITTSLTHNSLNQTTSPGTPGYDPKGQTTVDAEGRTFEWDEQGRVVTIVTGNKRSVFGYDGMSRRTVITEYENDVMVSKKLYWWLGGSIVTERDALQTDYPVTKRYFGQGVLRTASLGSGGPAKLYYTTDHLGSVRELLDESGNVVAEYRYSIYGERTKVAGDLDSDWGFAGLFHHEPSGLDLATYRLYDPKQRRFISRDPLGEAVDYNLYRYGGNNPVNYTDPAGLEPINVTVTGSSGERIPLGTANVFLSKATTVPSESQPGGRLNLNLGITLYPPPSQQIGWSTTLNPLESHLPGNEGWAANLGEPSIENGPTGTEGYFWFGKTSPTRFSLTKPGDVMTTLSIPWAGEQISVDAEFTLYGVNANNPGSPGWFKFRVTGLYRYNKDTKRYEIVDDPCE